MATQSKTSRASSGKKVRERVYCPKCGKEVGVVQYTGFGRKGFYWQHAEESKCQWGPRTDNKTNKPVRKMAEVKKG